MAKGAAISVHGQVAYTAQDPWVRNASLRDNILMGEKFDPIRYQEVLAACALVSDIALLPTGDTSEIGEKVGPNPPPSPPPPLSPAPPRTLFCCAFLGSSRMP